MKTDSPPQKISGTRGRVTLGGQGSSSYPGYALQSNTSSQHHICSSCRRTLHDFMLPKRWGPKDVGWELRLNMGPCQMWPRFAIPKDARNLRPQDQDVRRVRAVVYWTEQVKLNISLNWIISSKFDHDYAKSLPGEILKGCRRATRYTSKVACLPQSTTRPQSH